VQPIIFRFAVSGPVSDTSGAAETTSEEKARYFAVRMRKTLRLQKVENVHMPIKPSYCDKKLTNSDNFMLT
jgi:hypothetical protein